jgi:uncharacterized membrane protein YccC
VNRLVNATVGFFFGLIAGFVVSRFVQPRWQRNSEVTFFCVAGGAILFAILFFLMPDKWSTNVLNFFLKDDK